MKSILLSSFLITLLIFSSCGKLDLTISNFKSKTKFLGMVPSLNGLIVQKDSYSVISSAFAAPCSTEEVRAELYLLKSSGELEEEPVAQTQINSKGAFEFDFKKLRLSLNGKINHVVAISGCDEAFFSPVLELGKVQIVDYRSTFVTSAINSNLPVKLNDISVEKIQSLIANLNGSSVEAVNDNLAADAVTSVMYNNIFGLNPEDVKYAPVVSLVVPSIEIPEDAVYSFNPVVKKIDSDALVYEWSHESSVVSTSAKWDYHPNKNAQGQHNVILTVGKDNGSGGVDTTIPHFKKIYKFSVANTYFPKAPKLTYASLYSNSRSLVLNIDPAECTTFTKFAITEKEDPASLISADFTYTCLDSNIPFTLSDGDGVKRVYTYSTDDYDVISEGALKTITLDRAAPILSSTDHFFLGGSVYSGLRNELITWTSVDVNFGLNPIVISYSTDFGVSWISIISNKTNDGMYTWNLPDSDLSAVRLKIEATDLAGNTTSIISNLDFSIDSTPPDPLDIALDAGAYINSLNLTATVGSCLSDQKFMYIAESATIPARTDAKWVTCSSTSGALIHTLSTANGVKNLYVWAKDLAGNISTVTTKSIIYDSVAPVLGLTNPASGSYVNASNDTAIVFSGTCSENGLVEITDAITDSISCSGGSFSKTIDLSSLSEGSHSFTFNMKDAANNTSNVIVRTFMKDAVLPVVEITSPATSSYIKSLMTLTGTCSEEGRNVLISGAISKSEICENNEFEAVLNLASVAEGGVTLSVTQSDVAGNSAVAATRNFIKDTVAPVLTESDFGSGNYTNEDFVVFGGACEVGSSIVVSGTDSAVTVCTTGSWTYTTENKLSDGTYNYVFTHTDLALNSSVLNLNWKRDTVLPAMQSVVLAEGATYIGTSFVTVDLEASDDNQVKEIRLKNADTVTKECQSVYADDNWQEYTSGVRRYSTSITSGDGEKKICAWAKDMAGNISVISPTLGINGVNFGKVLYEVGNPPVVTNFTVTNSTGGANLGLNEAVHINWTVTDMEELAENPITISYTTSYLTTAEWTDVVKDYGNIGQGQKTHSGSLLTFKAPDAGYFRVKIVAKDIAGNVSLASEKTLNTGNWSVFAGSVDSGIGGNAQGLILKTEGSNSSGQYAAIDPYTNDAYVASLGEGIYKLNAVTGKVSLFLKHLASTNFVNNGTLDKNSGLFSSYVRMQFDKDGLLYLMETPTSANLAHGVIWQIDPKTLKVKKYLGGGSIYDGSATATTAHVQYGAFTFDESNSLYYLAHCSPGQNYTGSSAGTTALRLMKATQNSVTKMVDDISIVAGNCVRGNPTSGATGVDAVNSPFYNGGHVAQGGIAAWENGDKIAYYFPGVAVPYKINKGITYRGSVTGSPYYDHSNKELYLSTAGGSIYKVNMNFDASYGDTGSLYVLASGVDNCADEGIDRLSACITNYFVPFRGPSGRIAFLEGTTGNATTRYSVKYVDENDKLKTYVGNSSFYGENLHKSFMKSDIAGIYYKKAAEPNQAAFPEGLYFLDRSAMIMGYVDSSDNVSIIAGNQSKQATSSVTGDTFNKSVSLGIPYGHGTMQTLGFNSAGLPFLRIANGAKSVITVDSAKKIKFLTDVNSVTNNHFDMAAEGSSPAKYGVHVQGGINNFVIKNTDTLFLLGAYIHNVERPGILSAGMKAFNYSANYVAHIMGVNTASPAFTADSVSVGDVTTKKFSASCQSISKCYLVYRADQDRIYFSEDKRLRYVTDPESPNLSTLKTFYTSTRNIYNFIFSEDKTQLFYISDDGRLYCKDISSGKAWCNDTILGPTTGMRTLTFGANQLTWKNSTTLLISSYSGMIYQYNLLP